MDISLIYNSLDKVSERINHWSLV